ncbi:MAG: four-carbon acid sugar kinase family protein, partial [Rhodobacterales bacterium]
MSALLAIVIADDLTGSLDSISPFAARGLTCIVALSAAGIQPALAHAPQVLAVNLGTREVPAAEAARRAGAAVGTLMPAAGPGTVWIKKIDSRLKGPIAAEIAAMSEVLRPERVLLCPAIPDLGRIVQDGRLGVDGNLAPQRIADMVALALPCDIPDATLDSDLDRIVQTVRPGTLVGSARGLAAALARKLAPGGPVGAVIRPGPIGFAIGSRDPVTLAQVAALQADGRLPTIAAPDGVVPATAWPSSFLLQATEGPGAAGPVVAARLAEGLTPHIAGLTTLVLSGGETALAVLNAAGVRLLRVQGDVLPGVVLGRALDLPGLPYLVTKS